VSGIGEVAGRNVRRLRETQGLSGNELAKRAGVAQASVSELETGKIANPGIAVLAALAGVLQVSVDELLLDEGAQNAHSGPKDKPQG
jgi:transcriptional regulator with XRE-family HTH domain